MASRLELHEELCGVLGDENRVYFQPPASMYMEYPCIRYRKTGRQMVKANNSFYRVLDRYEIVVITEDPDDDEIGLAMIEHFGPRLGVENRYTADDLYHETYSLVY